jgi:hypothetical protein
MWQAVPAGIAVVDMGLVDMVAAPVGTAEALLVDSREAALAAPLQDCKYPAEADSSPAAAGPADSALRQVLLPVTQPEQNRR